MPFWKIRTQLLIRRTNLRCVFGVTNSLISVADQMQWLNVCVASLTSLWHNMQGDVMAIGA